MEYNLQIGYSKYVINDWKFDVCLLNGFAVMHNWEIAIFV